MRYDQLISSLWNKMIYLKTSFSSGFGEMMFHFLYNNIKVGVFWYQSNLDTVCGVQLISLLCLCSFKWKILVRCLYWVLITPKNFIFTSLGVIYPGSPTPALIAVFWFHPWLFRQTSRWMRYITWKSIQNYTVTTQKIVRFEFFNMYWNFLQSADKTINFLGCILPINIWRQATGRISQTRHPCDQTAAGPQNFPYRGWSIYYGMKMRLVLYGFRGRWMVVGIAQ
jgi:hypothetical protein